MPKSPSSVVRLTVPISGELSERISVLAAYRDLTRQQWVRRALQEYAEVDETTFAAVSDLSVEEWRAEASARWRAGGIPVSSTRANMLVDMRQDVSPRGA